MKTNKGSDWTTVVIRKCLLLWRDLSSAPLLSSVEQTPSSSDTQRIIERVPSAAGDPGECACRE